MKAYLHLVESDGESYVLRELIYTPGEPGWVKVFGKTTRLYKHPTRKGMYRVHDTIIHREAHYVELTKGEATL